MEERFAVTMGIDTEIDFSTYPDSDGEPMAENEVNREQMSDSSSASGNSSLRIGRSM